MFFLLLLSCMSFLYILDIRLLSEMLLANILSRLDGCLLTLLTVSFDEQKLFSLMSSHSFIFALTSLAFEVRFIKSSLSQR